MVGNHIDRFKEKDLVMIGPSLPHVWRFEESFFDSDGEFTGEGIIIRFSYDYLDQFFQLGENTNLNTCLKSSNKGCCFSNNTKEEVIPLMLRMPQQDSTERLYSLISIFKIINLINEYKLLSGPSIFEGNLKSRDYNFNRAIEFLFNNYNQEIRIDDMLEISHMAYGTFFGAIKNIYGMSFKELLIKLRIEYACHLLVYEQISISEIAMKSGFNSLANFHRQFKELKCCTPGNYRKQHGFLLSETG